MTEEEMDALIQSNGWTGRRLITICRRQGQSCL